MVVAHYFLKKSPAKTAKRVPGLRPPAPYIQSLDKVRHHRDGLCSHITPAPKGKTASHEVSPVERGIAIPLFWVSAKSLLFVWLQSAPGQPFGNFLEWSIERGHFNDLPGSGRPLNPLNANGGLSGAASNYATSMYPMYRYGPLIGTFEKRDDEVSSKETTQVDS